VTSIGGHAFESCFTQ
jgi:hypothetical protein